MRYYSAHRLAWLYTHGEWPAGQIDHINRDRRDNRMCNLRVVTHSENLQNIQIWRSNKSGQRGVSWNTREKIWRAQICHQKQQIYLGNFKDKQEAINAYKAAAKVYHKYNPHGEAP
jgi:hypothetical protein